MERLLKDIIIGYKIAVLCIICLLESRVAEPSL